jgi:hypothetical protein
MNRPEDIKQITSVKKSKPRAYPNRLLANPCASKALFCIYITS